MITNYVLLGLVARNDGYIDPQRSRHEWINSRQYLGKFRWRGALVHGLFRSGQQDRLQGLLGVGL